MQENWSELGQSQPSVLFSRSDFHQIYPQTSRFKLRNCRKVTGLQDPRQDQNNRAKLGQNASKKWKKKKKKFPLPRLETNPSLHNQTEDESSPNPTANRPIRNPSKENRILIRLFAENLRISTLTFQRKSGKVEFVREMQSRRRSEREEEKLGHKRGLCSTTSLLWFSLETQMLGRKRAKWSRF